MDNLKNSSNVKHAVPFFMVVNMDNSLNFYTKGLDFELKNKWEPGGKIEWCWLQLETACNIGFSLGLTEFQYQAPGKPQALAAMLETFNS